MHVDMHIHVYCTKSPLHIATDCLHVRFPTFPWFLSLPAWKTSINVHATKNSRMQGAGQFAVLLHELMQPLDGWLAHSSLAHIQLSVSPTAWFPSLPSIWSCSVWGACWLAAVSVCVCVCVRFIIVYRTLLEAIMFVTS